MWAYDKDYLLMVEICREHRHETPKTVQEWATLLGAGLLEDRFKDAWGKPRSLHAQTLVLVKLFQAYLKARFEIDGEAYRLVRDEPNGPTHSPTYRFEREAG